MNPGKLRHKITIQQRVSGQDGYGQPQETWTDVKTSINASVEPLHGRELLAAQQINSEITIRVCTRYHLGIASDMRILYGSRIFDILAPIDPEERHRELQIMCKELN